LSIEEQGTSKTNKMKSKKEIRNHKDLKILFTQLHPQTLHQSLLSTLILPSMHPQSQKA
jgi:hypothetical protein